MKASPAVRIAIAAFFVIVALIGAVVVALHSPADCIDTVTVIGKQPYVNSTCQ